MTSRTLSSMAIFISAIVVPKMLSPEYISAILHPRALAIACLFISRPPLLPDSISLSVGYGILACSASCLAFHPLDFRLSIKFLTHWGFSRLATKYRLSVEKIRLTPNYLLQKYGNPYKLVFVMSDEELLNKWNSVVSRVGREEALALLISTKKVKASTAERLSSGKYKPKRPYENTREAILEALKKVS